MHWKSLARCDKLAGQSRGPSDKLANVCGDGDRHVGIYASPDNWRTCYCLDRAEIIIRQIEYCVSSPPPSSSSSSLPSRLRIAGKDRSIVPAPWPWQTTHLHSLTENDWSSGGVDPATGSLDVPADVSRAGWGEATDRSVCLALEGLVSRDLTWESGNVKKCGRRSKYSIKQAQ